MRFIVWPGFLFAAVISASGLGPPAPPPAPAECRQFDFWLGDWEVTTRTGKVAGTSRIESIAGGRGLLENWSGAGGFTGKSVNTYNAAKKVWQQFWVGSDGTVLELSGGLTGSGAMALSDGRNRITWTAQADGSVEQLWETTAGRGQTWQVAFAGHYTHRK